MALGDVDNAIFNAEMCISRLRMQIATSRERGINTDVDEQNLACMLGVLDIRRQYKRFICLGRAFNGIGKG